MPDNKQYSHKICLLHALHLLDRLCGSVPHSLNCHVSTLSEVHEQLELVKARCDDVLRRVEPGLLEDSGPGHSDVSDAEEVCDIVFY